MPCDDYIHVYYVQCLFAFCSDFITIDQILSLSLSLVGVRLVLGLELEVGVRRSEEHLTIKQVSTIFSAFHI